MKDEDMKPEGTLFIQARFLFSTFSSSPHQHDHHRRDHTNAQRAKLRQMYSLRAHVCFFSLQAHVERKHPTTANQQRLNGLPVPA